MNQQFSTEAENCKLKNKSKIIYKVVLELKILIY